MESFMCANCKYFYQTNEEQERCHYSGKEIYAPCYNETFVLAE